MGSITKISIKNFKSFEDISFNINESFNIFIGENNSGKSTIFEAIILWKKCYDKLINSKRTGFYQAQTNKYISYQEFDFLRIINDYDLFHSNHRSTTIQLEICYENDKFLLGIEISKPSSISNAFYRIKGVNYSEFNKLAESMALKSIKLDALIFVYQTRPVAKILKHESYLNKAQISKEIEHGNSQEVLRNKILSYRDSVQKIEEQLCRVLQSKVKIQLPPKQHVETHEFIDVKIEFNGVLKDLHLQGSGLLQITEIISTIDFLKYPIKAILVDEPDSHIHAKLQSSLISHLRSLSDNQFFIITHNDSFVESAKDGEVFFIQDQHKKGLIHPTPISKFDMIKTSLGGILLNFCRLNKADRIVFVEGNDDAQYLEYINVIINSKSSGLQSSESPFFFPLRGKDNISSKIEYNKRSLNEIIKGKKIFVVFDRDTSDEDSDKKIKKSITGKGATPISHGGYCIESSLFESIKKIKSVISKHLPMEDPLACKQVDDYIDKFYENHLSEVTKATSPIYKELESAFESQKCNREEMQAQKFSSYIEECQIAIHRSINKKSISRFVNGLNSIYKIFDTKDGSDEAICWAVLKLYYDGITSSSEIPEDHLFLMETIYGYRNIVF